MFFKFKKGDMFINRIETHPKVEFFINSGSVYYDREKQPTDTNVVDGYLALNNFPIATRVALPPRLIITEGGDFIITEGGDNLETE